MSLPQGLVLTDLETVPDPGAIVVTPNPSEPFVSVLVTRKGGVVSAFRNKCPHAGYPLQHSSGRVIVQEGRFMVCAAHAASFALETGACAGGPCDNSEALERIAVVVRDGSVLVA